MRNILEITSNLLNRAAEYLLIVLTAGISLLIFTQVVFRYGLNHSLFWSEEIGRYTLVWITFIGASVGFKRKAHVGIDFLYNSFKPLARQWLTLLSDIILALLALILTVYGVQLTNFVKMQTSAALLISMSIPYSSIAVGGGLTFIHSFYFLVDDIINLYQRKEHLG